MTSESDFKKLVDRHFPGARLANATRLTGGVSADVYRLDLVPADGRAFSVVLRIHGATHGGHDADAEFQLLAALHRAGLPVPEPLFVDASRRHLKHPYLGIAFVDGSTAIADDAVDVRIDTMAETLRRIHRTRIEGAPDLPLRMDPLPELFDFLPAGSEWEALRQHLAGLTNTAFTGTPVLLHGDFWPENLIWREGRIAAVLDWEDAALGDPLSDVACTCLELRYVYGNHGMTCFREAYARTAPLDLKRFALWQIYVAAAAQKYMGDWRLDPAREAHMRQTALQTIRDAASALIA